jgi:hypothetical protein
MKTKQQNQILFTQREVEYLIAEAKAKSFISDTLWGFIFGLSLMRVILHFFPNLL